MPEDDGFIHLSLRCQITSRRSSKSFLSEQLDGSGEDVLSAVVFHK
jgi:hypothetical protein